MARCNVRDELGSLVRVAAHGYRSVDLAGESVMFALADDPDIPECAMVIEYQSGERTIVRGPKNSVMVDSLLH